MNKRPRVLVIDDDIDEMKPVVARLQEEYSVQSEHNPFRVEEYLEWAPDVCIIDIRLPGRDGFECAEAVRAGGCNSDIIFISGYMPKMDESILEAIESEAVFFLRKPCPPSVVAATVRRSLRERAIRHAAAAEMERAEHLQNMMRPSLSSSQLDIRLDYAHHAASGLCGDMVFYLWRDNSLMFLVADVMGHGPRAALLVPLLHVEFRRSVERGGSVADICSAIADGMKYFPGDSFVTGVVGQICAKNGIYTIHSAGHCGVIQIGSDGLLVSKIESTGSIFMPGEGVLPSQITLASGVLNSGERLYIPTDGLTEAPTRGGAFGEDGLVALCQHCADKPLEGLATKVLETMQSKRVSTGPCDDMTLLVIERD